MGELQVHSLSISLDGFVAGPGQGAEHPLGRGGPLLHERIFSPDATETDRRFLDRGREGIGATIMGGNVFGPVRGEWGASEWTGWWGEEPPFHHEVFVLTHHPRLPVSMAGGTSFVDLGDALDGWRCVEFAPSASVVHVRLRSSRGSAL